AAAAGQAASAPFPWQASLTAGCLAGLATDAGLFPLDTLKTRAQARGGFLAHGGFRGIYRGLGGAVAGSIPSAGAYFVAYDAAKAWFHGRAETPPRDDAALPIAQIMLAASVGEFIACTIRVPFEVVKQRLQTSVPAAAAPTAAAAAAIAAIASPLPPPLATTRSVIQAIRRAEGYRGFYRGWGITLIREIPFTCLQFPLYEVFRGMVVRHNAAVRPRADADDTPSITPLQAAGCGALSGALAGWVTTPLDVLKTRAAARGRATPARGAAGWTTARLLFAGAAPRVVWIALGGALFLGVYE
ncbi:hypothetical protein CXG81DRAFT_5942, partial [Caulochytrium protostelioides]